MKSIVLLFALFFGMKTSFAQDQQKSKTLTIEIQTSAVCDQCKERIENTLNYTKGIVFAELDLVTKKVTVKYKSDNLSVEQIRKIIADLGYDADEVKANSTAKGHLPECCKIEK